MKISAKGVSSSQPRGYIQRWSLQDTPQTRLGWLFDSMACQRQSASHQPIYPFFQLPIIGQPKSMGFIENYDRGFAGIARAAKFKTS